MDKVPAANITFSTASTGDHFRQIIRLQQQNHQQQLTPEQQAAGGFLFAEHTEAVLQKMALKMPQVIALSDGQVIAYNLAMDLTMENELPMLTPMFRQFAQCRYKEHPLTHYRFMVGGQVCVDERFRGQGLLGRLYQETGRLVADRFQLCVTEISSRNTVSLKTHRKMGFQSIGRYQDDKELWEIVAWELGAQHK